MPTALWLASRAPETRSATCCTVSSFVPLSRHIISIFLLLLERQLPIDPRFHGLPAEPVARHSPGQSASLRPHAVRISRSRTLKRPVSIRIAASITAMACGSAPSRVVEQLLFQVKYRRMHESQSGFPKLLGDEKTSRRQLLSIDRPVLGKNRSAESLHHRLVRFSAGASVPDAQVHPHGSGSSLAGQFGRYKRSCRSHSRPSGPPAPCQVCSASRDRIAISIAIVSGPTPPGTGV